MPLMTAAEQDLRHRSGMIEQDQGRGIARLEIGKRLIAHAAREPFGAIRCTAAGANAQIIVHENSL
jgi:hypothetical protein